MSANDLEEPLTPSHLMVGRKLMDAPEGLDPDPGDFNTLPDALTRRAKYTCTSTSPFTSSGRDGEGSTWLSYGKCTNSVSVSDHPVDLECQSAMA